MRFFNNLVGSAQPIVSVATTGSPFSYTASGRGFVTVTGGSVSGATLKRAGTTIDVSPSTIPVMNGDVVTLAYSVPPVVSFIPG
jgi:hypothetical protein